MILLLSTPPLFQWPWSKQQRDRKWKKSEKEVRARVVGASSQGKRGKARETDARNASSATETTKKEEASHWREQESTERRHKEEEETVEEEAAAAQRKQQDEGEAWKREQETKKVKENSDFRQGRHLVAQALSSSHAVKAASIPALCYVYHRQMEELLAKQQIRECLDYKKGVDYRTDIYMADEYRNNPFTFTFQSEVFSAGVVLMVLLTSDVSLFVKINYRAHAPKTSCCKLWIGPAGIG